MANLSISYQLNTDDLLALQLYMASRSARVRKERLVNWLLVPILSFAGFVALMATQTAGIVPWLLLAWSLSWFAFYRVWQRKRYYEHYRNHILDTQKARLGIDVTLHLDGESLQVKDDTSEGKTNLSQVSELIRLPEHFLIVFGKATAVVVPVEGHEADVEHMAQTLSESLNIRVTDATSWKWQ